MLVVRNHRGVDQRDVPNRGVDTAVGGQHAGKHEPAKGIAGEDVGRPVGAFPNPAQPDGRGHRQATALDGEAQGAVADPIGDDEEEAVEQHRPLDMAAREGAVFAGLLLTRTSTSRSGRGR